MKPLNEDQYRKARALILQAIDTLSRARVTVDGPIQNARGWDAQSRQRYNAKRKRQLREQALKSAVRLSLAQAHLSLDRWLGD